jgi:N-methylhydantoinase B
MEAGYRAFNAVLKALAHVAPTSVMAGGNDTTHVTSVSHLEANRYRVYLEIYGGGWGATAAQDGGDGIDSALSNCTNTPVEATDMDFDHFRIIGYGLLPDSCGHGRHRGGLGLFRRFEILKDGVNFAIYADRFRLAPYGLFGGTDGTRARCEVERDGRIIPVRSKDTLELRRGDILTLYTAGGGGYGPPAERAGAAIARDIAQGFLTEEAALAAYGRTG